MDAGEFIARLEARLKMITRIGGQMKTDKNSQGLVPHTPSLGYHLEPPGLKINLPKLQLPTFDGNICHWQEFWDTFKSLIHEQTNLPDVSKFSYLKSLLRGSALSAITGISMTSENYPLVIKLLMEGLVGKK